MNCSRCLRAATLSCSNCGNYGLCDQCHGEEDVWTEEKIIDFYNNGYMIGRGGFGKVYGNDSYPTIAIKFSVSKVDCASYLKEFDSASKICRVQKETNFQNDHYEVIPVYADVSNIVLPEDGRLHCALVMERVHRPDLQFGRMNQYSYQFYMGTEESRILDDRGNYIGLSVIRQLLDDATISEFAFSAGRFIAFLHFAVEIDAGDMEYLIGYAQNQKTLKIYALDFDRVKSIKAFAPGVIQDLEWSIAAEPYFPQPSDGILYEKFKAGYLEVGAKFGRLSMAEQVLKRYEENNS